MNTDLVQAIRSHSLMLGSFAVVTALLLGLVNAATRDEITLQQQEAERRALYEVLPPALHNNDLLADTVLLGLNNSPFTQIELLGLTGDDHAYIARLNNNITGFIFPAEAHDGYSGDIRLLVGINVDGTLSGVRVINHRETPGLGDKVDLRVSDWILGFNNKSLQLPQSARWQVRKDNGDFDQFVGATITPRAVVKAVKNALIFFENNQAQLLGQTLPELDKGTFE